MGKGGGDAGEKCFGKPGSFLVNHPEPLAGRSRITVPVGRRYLLQGISGFSHRRDHDHQPLPGKLL